jgi:hypothetical protein
MSHGPLAATSPHRTLPVLYLDLDDTVISWADGYPSAAPGAHSFVLWALARFEVRWLTTWCPDGEMPPNLLRDLCTMLEFDTPQLMHVRGFSWATTGSKLNGLAWLEHLLLDRPFLWIEDENGFRDGERRVLSELGLIERYRHCNVTRDPLSLRRLHRTLEAEWQDPVAVSAVAHGATS